MSLDSRGTTPIQREAASAAIKVRRLKWEEWERQCREHERQRRENERRVTLEKTRRAQLLSQVAGREHAVQIRQLITDIANAARQTPEDWPVSSPSWINVVRACLFMLHFLQARKNTFQPHLPGKMRVCRHSSVGRAADL
jgi:hypothetical protein